MMVALGASHALTVDDIDRASDAITSTKILLTQLEVPLDATRAAIRLAHQSGAKIIFDPARCRSRNVSAEYFRTASMRPSDHQFKRSGINREASSAVWDSFRKKLLS